MKKYRLILSMLAVLLCVMSTGCSSKDTEYSNASEPPFYSLRATSDFNTLEPPQTQDIVMEP